MIERQDRPEIAFHDEISSRWETLHQSRTFRSRTAAMFGLLETSNLTGQHWLDAGCGTGALSRLLAIHGTKVTGVDASSEMIAAARAQAIAPELSNRLAFQHIQTIASLPFADHSFDGVLCASVLEYVPDVVKCLDEIRRVLRPDGLLLVSIPNRQSLLRRSYKLAHAATARLSPNPLFHYLAYSKFDLYPSAVKRLLGAHGFTLLRTSYGGSPLPAALDRRSMVGTLINILARRDR